MPFTEPLAETPPASVLKALQDLSQQKKALQNGRRNGHASANGHAPEGVNGADDLRLSVAADLRADGTLGERWLAVEHGILRVLTANGQSAAAVDFELPLLQIQEVRIETLVGSSALLLVAKDGRTVEAVRCTSAKAALFSAVARILQASVTGEEAPASVAEGLRKKTCPKCGDPLPDDSNVCPRCIDRRAVLARLFSYALPYRVSVILFTALMLLGTALSLLPPILQKHLMDDVLVPHRHFSWIGWIMLGLIAFNALAIALSIWRGRIAAYMSTHMIYALRTQVYDHLQTLSLSYYDKRQTGSLMARVTQDVNELQQFIVDGIQFTLVNTLTIVGIVGVLLSYNWKLTLLVLVPVPVTVILIRAIWKVLWSRLHRLYFLRAGVNATINSVLSGVRVVKAFGQEPREMDRFNVKAKRLFEAQVVVERAWATYFPILGFITTLGTYIIWYIGGREVFANFSNSPAHGMTLGTLSMFLAYIGMLMMPLQSMTRMPDWLSRSTASAERVFEVIDTIPDVQDAPEPVAMPRIDGRVELKNVRFSYDKNHPVLQDISLSVEAGEMIGLVGRSGAGKSTFINLLSRFYDVQEGQILIDGIDIRNIKIEDLRRQIGVVLQESFLFPGTIADNIAYARPDAGAEEIMRAAKAANAHHFIMRFPDGYDTFVGERGARLSGGERQRISIARAILHDPRILILDEATASVDTETEKQIQEAIARLIQGRTTFAIAHRLSTLRNASRLLVLDQGKLVEMGTHDELLSLQNGVFRKLVDMQQEINKIHAV